MQQKNFFSPSDNEVFLCSNFSYEQHSWENISEEWEGILAKIEFDVTPWKLLTKPIKYIPLQKEKISFVTLRVMEKNSLERNFSPLGSTPQNLQITTHHFNNTFYIPLLRTSIFLFLYSIKKFSTVVFIK